MKAGVKAAGSPVEAYLSRLRRRAALVHGVRGSIAAGGAGAAVFAAGAVAFGPVGSPIVAGLAWALAAAAACAVAVRAWRAFSPLRGSGAARLLAGERAELASAARTAFELGRDLPRGASPAMAKAHGERVAAALVTLPPARVVRARELGHRAVLLGAAGMLLAAGLLGTERGSAGAYALVHPGATDDRGARVAVVFADVEAHLVYPTYLDRPAAEVSDPRLIEVPRGTSIELYARPRVATAATELSLGPHQARMERLPDGRFVGRLVAREDGPLVLRLRERDGAWIRDATERLVRALADEAPRISLVEPAQDVVLDRPIELGLEWDASDDVGLASVDLVVRGEQGRETRRRVASYEAQHEPAQATGSAPLDLAMLGALPGDTLSVWLEARDGDVVSGPNVGRSRELAITVASESTRRREALDRLEGLLDAALSVLASRLEQEVPADGAAAVRRWEGLQEPTLGLVDALLQHAEDVRQSEQGRSSDAALYGEMAARVRRLAHEERSLHRQPPAPVAERREVDGRAVRELEDDALRLDDLVGRARVEDAAAIAREIEALRREIRSLLDELRRTDSAEARERLLGAIARAQARMRDLIARLSEMGTSVPEEFMNQGEMGSPAQTQSALEQLREAVQRGDLERADQLMSELARQIDQLARALGQTEESFVEARFGPRERALAEAMDALAGLEAEQQSLARRGVERRSRAAQRALDELGEGDGRTAQRLLEQAQRARQALEEVGRERLASFEQEAFDRARERLRDTEAALSTGDLGEARAMSEQAEQDLATLSRDLDLSALMFGGAQGETTEGARQAREADRMLGELRRDLDEALPDIGAHVDGQDRAQMRTDTPRQREARAATERLAGQFAQGPEGTPLEPSAARQLEDIERIMQQAAGSLGRGDPLESARQQEEAARQLTELRERLEQEQRGGGGGGGEGAEQLSRQPVRIPGADQFEGPMELRRRLLDAMREGAPAGFEESVRRYYEGLLR